jgi:hypothetical protein
MYTCILLRMSVCHDRDRHSQYSTSPTPATGKRQTKNQSKHKNMEKDKDTFVSHGSQVIPSPWQTFSSSFQQPRLITTSVRTANRQLFYGSRRRQTHPSPSLRSVDLQMFPKPNNFSPFAPGVSVKKSPRSHIQPAVCAVNVGDALRFLQ